MLWPGIKKLGRELQLKRGDSQIAGRIKNCFVKMFDGNNIKVLELFAPQIDPADNEFVIEQLKVNKVKTYDWLENGVRITFHEIIRPYSINKIKSLLNELVEYFEKKYPANTPRCHKCGDEKSANTYCVGNDSLYLCDDCIKEYENTANEEYWKYQQLPANYLSGFLGALLFSIPGVLITILLFVFLQRLGALSAALYILLGMAGYKKFKGKISPFGAFVVIAAGIIMTGAGVFTAYCAYILWELKTIDFELLKFILGMPEIQRELKMNLGISYAVSGIYIIFELFQMMKQWKFSVKIQEPRDI